MRKVELSSRLTRITIATFGIVEPCSCLQQGFRRCFIFPRSAVFPHFAWKAWERGLEFTDQNTKSTCVAVGAGVTSCPPRRSRRAAFPHRAPVEGQTRPAFGAWAAHPVPVRGCRPSGTCGFRLCVRSMCWPLPFLQPAAFPPRSPPPTCRPVLFEASSVLCSRPTPQTFRSGFGSSPFRTGPGSPWRLRAA